MGSPARHLMHLISRRRPLFYSAVRRLSSNAAAASSDYCPPNSLPPAETSEKDDTIYVKRPNSSLSSSSATRDEVSVTMPTTFMTGSVVGKRFYKEVTTRMAYDGNGWSVMLDYRTLKTPLKRPLKLPNLALAKAIAAEWEYQLADGIRPFTMPLMKLACTAIERVPLTRMQIIKNLIDKFHQDLVFCRSPGDTDLTKGVRGLALVCQGGLLAQVTKTHEDCPGRFGQVYGCMHVRRSRSSAERGMRALEMRRAVACSATWQQPVGPERMWSVRRRRADSFHVQVADCNRLTTAAWRGCWWAAHGPAAAGSLWAGGADGGLSSGCVRVELAREFP